MAQLLVISPTSSSSDNDQDEYPSSHTNIQQQRRRFCNRTKLSQNDQTILQKFFSDNQYPDYSEREALANQIGINETKVQIWFQNRRTRLRRKNVVIDKPRNLPGPEVRRSSLENKLNDISPRTDENRSQERTRNSPANNANKPKLLHSIENILKDDSPPSRKRPFCNVIDDVDEEEGDSPLDLSMGSKRPKYEHNLLDVSMNSTYAWLPHISLMQSPYHVAFNRPSRPLDLPTFNLGLL